MTDKPKKHRPPTDRIPPEAAPRAEHRYAVTVVCGLLLLAVVLVFGQTIGFGFVNFDDNDYAYDNPHLQRGLSVEGIVWALSTTHACNWHPLTWLSFLADYQLSGLAPWECHLENLLLHAAAAIGLFLVLRQMTGDLWPSAFVAAVFAVHPLRAESVAWIAERKDMLSGLFFMLTLAAYTSYVRRPFSLVRYALVAVLFALGLMAKPMLVTLPLVLLLLDYWPLERRTPGWRFDSWGGSCTATPGATVQLSPQRTTSIRRLVVEKLPLLALSAASCAVTSWAQGGAIKRFDVVSLSTRIGNALVSYVAYIGQLFYPAGLAVFYPHEGSDLPAWKIAAALAVLVGISVGAVLWRRSCPYLLLGWCWYLGMLVPVIGLVQVGQQSMADRYTYLPQIGLVIAVAWGAKCSLGAWPYRTWLLGAVSVLAVVALMECARRQVSYWRDSDILWTRDLQCAPNNATAHLNLGVTQYEQGRFAEALAHYQKALEIKPHYAEAYTNLGSVLTAEGKDEEAVTQHEKALEFSPNYAVARYNLGLALYNLGRLDEAVAQSRWALRLNPYHAEAHNNLGNALTRQGKLDEAIEEYGKAVEIKPNYARAHYNLGIVLYQQGRVAEAIAQYEKALEFEPDDPDTYVNLGIALARQGRMGEAIGQLQKAIEIKPNDAASRLNLAAAYAEAGQFAEAVETAQKAMELARQQNQTRMMEPIQAKIRLYQSGAPVREKPPALPDSPRP